MHLDHTLEIVMIVVSVVVAAIGMGAAWSIYKNGFGAPAQSFAAAMPGLVSLVRDKFRVDELYDLIIIRPIKALSRGLFLLVDRVLIDQVMVHGVAVVVDVFGRIARTFQVGDVQRYLAAFAIGLFALFYLAVKPPPPDELKVSVKGATVDVDASTGAPAGRALQYDFDFDEDGYADKSGKSPKARFSYEGRGNYTIRVTIRDERWSSSTTVSKRVEIQ